MTPALSIETQLRLAPQWEQIPAVVEDIVRIAGFYLRDQIGGEAPTDTGLLRGSFDYSIEDGGDTFHLWTPVKYASYVATGTRPHFAPWDPIDEWAKRHKLPTFPIWYAIATKGTKPNPYPERAFEALEKNMDNLVSKVLLTRGLL